MPKTTTVMNADALLHCLRLIFKGEKMDTKITAIAKTKNNLATQGTPT
jgi:hypothetical protein